MGRQRGPEAEGKAAAGPGAAPAPEPEKVEDPPVVKRLKEVDDKFLALEKEFEREVRQLRLKFREREQPLLEERVRILNTPEDNAPKAGGTPAIENFWLTAMQNHPAFEDIIQEWDEPVLAYLADIQVSPSAAAEEDENVTTFKITFKFVENPFFTNTELVKEYRTAVVNPYCGEVEVKEITATKVEWKAGKDITVEKVAKKVKGGGAKKAKQKKEKEEPRPSFFRDFFRNLKPDMELPEDAREQARSYAEEQEDDDDDDDLTLVSYLMDADHEVAEALRENIVPWAVRWYTGEAAPEDDDDDDDEDEEEEDGEEEDDDDDDDEEDAAPARGRPKGGRHPAPKPKAAPGKKGDEGAQPGKEECKQQ